MKLTDALCEPHPLLFLAVMIAAMVSLFVWQPLAIGLSVTLGAMAGERDAARRVRAALKDQRP